MPTTPAVTIIAEVPPSCQASSAQLGGRWFAFLGGWRRPERAALLVLTAILLIAASVRFYGLDREGLWGDEYIQVVQYPLPPHYTAWNAVRVHALGPLDFLVGWVVHRIDPSVWAYRLPSAVWGVAGIAACFFLVRRLASWREGLIAAGLLCFCRMNLILSQEIRPYSMALTFLLVLLILLMRAIEQPSWRRVLLYGVMCYLCPLTRSFTPMMFQASLAIVLGVAFFRTRRRGSGVAVETVLVLKRLLMATIIAGVLTLPMLALMLDSPRTRVYTVFPGMFKQNSWGGAGGLVGKLMQNSIIVGETLLASYGAWVLALAGVGVVVCIKRRGTLSVGVRCTLAAMLLVAPLFVTVFSIVVKYQTVADRYNFYLMPVVAAFAAIACVQLAGWAWRRWSLRPMAVRTAIVVFFLTVFAYPVAMSAEETRSYRRRDWRGCGAYLQDLVKPDDVVAVLSERPFGMPQHPFRGKHDWPAEGRPLAEAFWTMATSGSHFLRFLGQEGRCFLVISYPVEPQAKDAYLERGLVEAPSGYRLVKFRGLDLLIRDKWDGPLGQEVLAGCDDLLELPRKHSSTNAVLLTFRARVLQHQGNLKEAAKAVEQARKLVPPAQSRFFEYAISGWAGSLEAVSEEGNGP